MRRFVVITGYHAHPAGLWQQWYFPRWWQQNIEPIKQAGLQEVYIFATATSPAPAEKRGHWIPVQGDIGCCDDIIIRSWPFWCPACPAAWISGAWLAYSGECDLLYVEQDCLCFGPWLEQMYADLGNKGMVFGYGKLHSGSSTCLYLMRHDFIPTWTAQYVAEGSERIPSRIAEHKMRRMRERAPENYATLSFGYDTDRPFDPTDRVFYLQKITPEEMDALKRSGRLLFTYDRAPLANAYTNNAPSP